MKEGKRKEPKKEKKEREGDGFMGVEERGDDDCFYYFQK